MKRDKAHFSSSVKDQNSALKATNKTWQSLLWQLCKGLESSLGCHKPAESMELGLHRQVGHTCLVPLLLHQRGQRQVDQLLFVLSKQTLQQWNYELSSPGDKRDILWTVSFYPWGNQWSLFLTLTEPVKSLFNHQRPSGSSQTPQEKKRSMNQSINEGENLPRLPPEVQRRCKGGS